MISAFKDVELLLEKISSNLKEKASIYIIGGAALLSRGLKPSTKDIDVVVCSKEEYYAIRNALKSIGFNTKAALKGYEHLNISQLLKKDSFQIDLFLKKVCGKFSLSKGIIGRSEKIFSEEKLKASCCSNEDIFLFKTMTEREGDLADCISLAKTGLKWQAIIDEIRNQIKDQKQDIWITWIASRLELLEDKGVNIPIMKDIQSMTIRFYRQYEKEKKLRKKFIK